MSDDHHDDRERTAVSIAKIEVHQEIQVKSMKVFEGHIAAQNKRIDSLPCADHKEALLLLRVEMPNEVRKAVREGVNGSVSPKKTAAKTVGFGAGGAAVVVALIEAARSWFG